MVILKLDEMRWTFDSRFGVVVEVDEEYLKNES